MANDSEAATIAAEIEAARVAADAACRAWAAAVEAAARDAVPHGLPDAWFYNFTGDRGYIALRDSDPESPVLTVAMLDGRWTVRVRQATPRGALQDFAHGPTIQAAMADAAADPAWPWGRE